MKLLLCILSLFFGSTVFADHVVTVIHPSTVTWIYDPIRGTATLHSPTQYEVDGIIGGEGTNPGVFSDDSNGISSMFTGQDGGMVNAKATASMIGSKTNSRQPTTGAITDASSAFRMSLPFAFGTAAAVILAAIIF